MIDMNKELFQPRVDNLQTATPNDIDGIVEVERQSWGTTYPNEEEGIAASDVKNRFRDLSGRRRAIQEEMAMENHRYTVVKVGSKIIGYAHVLREQRYNDLVEMYILADYQNQQIGRRLLEEALSWLGSEKPVELEVVTYNTRAMAFYRKFGFVEKRMRQQSEGEEWNMLPSGKRMPVVFMVRQPD
jgi:ribosomal protein S18 acetylase RimI-like enzyme